MTLYLHMYNPTNREGLVRQGLSNRLKMSLTLKKIYGQEISLQVFILTYI